jgi:hypothetical protein
VQRDIIVYFYGNDGKQPAFGYKLVGTFPSGPAALDVGAENKEKLVVSVQFAVTAVVPFSGSAADAKFGAGTTVAPTVERASSAAARIGQTGNSGEVVSRINQLVGGSIGGNGRSALGSSTSPLNQLARGVGINPNNPISSGLQMFNNPSQMLSPSRLQNTGISLLSSLTKSKGTGPNYMSSPLTSLNNSGIMRGNLNLSGSSKSLSNTASSLLRGFGF